MTVLVAVWSPAYIDTVLPSVYCLVCTELLSQPVCVHLLLSVLISHTDAERQRGKHTHTHTHTLVLIRFVQMTDVMRSSWFKCLGSLSEHISPLHLLQLLLFIIIIIIVVTWASAVLPAHSVCLTNAAVADICPEQPQDTFRMNFLCCITLTDSDREERQTWTQSIRPLLFKYSECFSDASLNTKAFICKYELFTHMSLFPSTQKQASMLVPAKQIRTPASRALRFG